MSTLGTLLLSLSRLQDFVYRLQWRTTPSVPLLLAVTRNALKNEPDECCDPFRWGSLRMFQGCQAVHWRVAQGKQGTLGQMVQGKLF